MQMIFCEERFPVDISYGSSGGPIYATDITALANGYEQRNINWQYPKSKYNIAPGIKNAEQMAQLLAFFHNMRGRALGFRYKDWADFRAHNQHIAIADGINSSFQLYKTYRVGEMQMQRIIKKPVPNTLMIYLDGVVEEGVAIDYEKGLLTFNDVPEQGAVITANFEFDVPVRFETDHLNSSIENYETFLTAEIPLIEIRV